MSTAIMEFLTSHLGGVFSREVLAFIISMVPILELRGGIIFSALSGIPLLKAVIICAVGNLLPVPFILLLITPIFNWLKKLKYIKPIVEKLENRTLKKKDKLEKYEFLGLVLFVGIPLPGTGAWTGSFLACLVGMKFRKAFPAVALGMLLAMCIMIAICYLMPSLIFG